MRWETFYVEVGANKKQTEKLQLYLDEGWEPYAVTSVGIRNVEHVWLRRQVQG